MVEHQLLKLGLTPIVYEQPPKFFPYWFEENDVNENRIWARQQLPTCIAIGFVYFVFVILGPAYMKNRNPFNLKHQLTIWNFSLALFSIFGVLRCFPEFFDVINQPNGFHISACVNQGFNQPLTFWAFLFAFSKIAELVDTVFIVLRKKHLSFLHWFHHMTMVYSTFFMFSEADAFARWPAFLNFCVHSVMYTYFGIMSLGIKLPRRIAMTVTIIQLLQFCTVLVVSFYTMAVVWRGEECHRTWASMKLSVILGTAYLLLFLRLFYNSYLVSKPKKKD